MLTIIVRLHHPETIPQRELDAIERDLTERLSLAAMMPLPKGAYVEIAGERIESIAEVAEVVHG